MQFNIAHNKGNVIVRLNHQKQSVADNCIERQEASHQSGDHPSVFLEMARNWPNSANLARSVWKKIVSAIRSMDDAMFGSGNNHQIRSGEIRQNGDFDLWIIRVFLVNFGLWIFFFRIGLTDWMRWLILW